MNKFPLYAGASGPLSFWRNAVIFAACYATKCNPRYGQTQFRTQRKERELFWSSQKSINSVTKIFTSASQRLQKKRCAQFFLVSSKNSCLCSRRCKACQKRLEMPSLLIGTERRRGVGARSQLFGRAITVSVCPKVSQREKRESAVL